jgi:hypothetical protein
MSAQDLRLLHALKGSLKSFENIVDIATHCQDRRISTFVADREALVHARLLLSALHIATEETEQLIQDLKIDCENVPVREE